MKKIVFIPACFFFLFFHPSGSNAQYISGAMEFVNPVLEKDSNSISLQYSSLFYLKDYEYFNKIQTGYTLFGSWHFPRLAIQPNRWLKMEAGVLLQKDFGDTKLSNVLPVFSLQINSRHLRFLFGALEGSQAHHLIEPLMSYDKVIERPVETGGQVILNSKKVSADLWIDWELRQAVNASHPEELTAGLNCSYMLTEPGKSWKVRIPLQFILPHKGGQLDTNNSPVVTLFNMAGGAEAEYKAPDQKKILQEIRAGVFGVRHRTAQRQNTYTFTKGAGLMFNLFLRSRWNLALLGSYWNGNKYIAPKGAKIHQSVSSIPGRNYTEEYRELLFLNLIYEKEVFPGFFIDSRYSPLFNLRKGTYEHAWQMLISYRNNFRLGRLKK